MRLRRRSSRLTTRSRFPDSHWGGVPTASFSSGLVRRRTLKRPFFALPPPRSSVAGRGHRKGALSLIGHYSMLPNLIRAILSVVFLLTVAVRCPAQAKIAPADARQPPGAAHVPYDGTGRYTMDQDDGIRSIQGLAMLATRYGVKPYKELTLYRGCLQTERVIFHDVETKTTLVRITNDPWADQLSYFGGNWSATEIHHISPAAGDVEPSTFTHGPMEVLSDGTDLHNAFRDYKTVRNEICSPKDPNLCFAIVNGSSVVAFKLNTEKFDHFIREVTGCWHMKISPDGEYLMGRSDLERGGRGIWIVSKDGKEYHEILIPEAIHDSYQFHPTQKKIMFWYEDRYRTERFVQCDFDGKEMTKVPVLFDWNHGDVGLDRGVHTEGYITRIKEDTWLPKEPLFHLPGVEYDDNPANYNGYATWQPKDLFRVYATRTLALPYLSELQCFFADPVPEDVVNRYRICYTGLKRGLALDNPNASPDGTKVLFNSNMFNRVDVYYAVAKLPEPPQQLTAISTQQGITLRWKPPKHHAEIAGYRVYRSNTSGIDYIPIYKQLVNSTEFNAESTRSGGPFYYSVSSVEHSGLESTLSEEIVIGNLNDIKHRIFIEAENANLNPKLWIALDGFASNIHYVWMRNREEER